jgi:sporulation protein YlmC with PRC-barrel domain
MQHSLKSMIGFEIRATDGDLGNVHEFYFDDITWTVRYIVVETKKWFSSRKVLISLCAIGKPDWETRTLPVNLTCIQVRNSPDIDTQKPVYRQHEVQLHEHYQWPKYWDGFCGNTMVQTQDHLLDISVIEQSFGQLHHDDPHLRGTSQVIGYKIHATDGDIGYVDDFIIDDENGVFRYLVVNTGNWLPGRKVLISPQWVKCINWDDSSVYLNLLRDSVKYSADFNPDKIINREFQEIL